MSANRVINRALISITLSLIAVVGVIGFVLLKTPTHENFCAELSQKEQHDIAKLIHRHLALRTVQAMADGQADTDLNRFRNLRRAVIHSATQDGSATRFSLKVGVPDRSDTSKYLPFSGHVVEKSQGGWVIIRDDF